MIVSVNYRDSKTGQFRGRAYSYLCDIPDIQPGDKVIAPTATGENEAVIVEINVPESRVDERIMPLLKTITQRKEEQMYVE
ncbi:Uncharacterised protein [Flavonifractor plautii]|nr:Uncharacterised protein [Flavonifractor plautii]